MREKEEQRCMFPPEVERLSCRSFPLVSLRVSAFPRSCPPPFPSLFLSRLHTLTSFLIGRSLEEADAIAARNTCARRWAVRRLEQRRWHSRHQQARAEARANGAVCAQTMQRAMQQREQRELSRELAGVETKIRHTNIITARSQRDAEEGIAQFENVVKQFIKYEKEDEEDVAGDLGSLIGCVSIFVEQFLFFELFLLNTCTYPRVLRTYPSGYFELTH